MYALTVHQPHASALFGPKAIETRSHTQFRHMVGKPIAIHAGLVRDAFSLADAAACGWDADELVERWPHLFDGSELPAGAVIGTAYCHQFLELGAHNSRAAMTPCDEGNLHGLLLTRRRLFPEPILYRGAQGLWFWTEPDFVRREGYFPEID